MLNAEGARFALMLAFMLGMAAMAHTHAVLTQTIVSRGQTVAIHIAKGDSLDQVLTQLQAAGLMQRQPYAWVASVWLDAERRTKAGEYELNGPMDALDILAKVIDGRGILHTQTLFEGWTIHEMLEAMEQNPTVRRTKEPWKEMGFDVIEDAEGWCLPDTYKHYRGDPDIKILALCVQAMRLKLPELWASRASGLPYEKPEDALIMASIVEAETSLDEERPLVAGVLLARLERDMRLQADPTVIYGLGKDFDGNLTRRHLRDGANPFNTYRIHGLPPGPIGNPGLKSLQAALHPDMESGFLYYVAVGDGSHFFSKTYKEHRKAVNKYQKKRKRG